MLLNSLYIHSVNMNKVAQNSGFQTWDPIRGCRESVKIINSFIHSFIHSFIYSFIHSFILGLSKLRCALKILFKYIYRNYFMFTFTKLNYLILLSGQMSIHELLQYIKLIWLLFVLLLKYSSIFFFFSSKKKILFVFCEKIGIHLMYSLNI